VPPAAPSSLVASCPNSTTELDLTWNNNSSADGILVERSTNGGSTYTQVRQLSPNATSYNDTGLNPQTTYTYQVIAYNSVGTAPSNTSSATTMACSYVISPTSASFAEGGGSGSFTVSAGAVCSWSAISNAPWITITGGATGSGNGTVSFSVQSNGSVARTGSISVGGHVFTIAQGGIVTIYPGAYQTPDPVTGGQAVSNPFNRGHGDTTTWVELDHIYSSSQKYNSCLWNVFPDVPGLKTRVTLKFDWNLTADAYVYVDTDADTSASASYIFQVGYSLDNTRTTGQQVVSQNARASLPVGITGGDQDSPIGPISGSESIDMPNPGAINIGQISVGELVRANCSISTHAHGYAYTQGTFSVSNIRLEVVIAPPVISNVAAGGITTSGATITWTSKYNSDSQVEHGVDTGYGQSAPATPKQIIQRWPARPFGRAGLVLLIALIACGVLALLFPISRGELKRTDRHRNRFWWLARAKPSRP
jgi:hypothetical protein